MLELLSVNIARFCDEMPSPMTILSTINQSLIKRVILTFYFYNCRNGQREQLFTTNATILKFSSRLKSECFIWFFYKHKHVRIFKAFIAVLMFTVMQNWFHLKHTMQVSLFTCHRYVHTLPCIIIFICDSKTLD